MAGLAISVCAATGRRLGRELVVNSRNPWVHPALCQRCCCWWCNGTGNVFLEHLRPLTTSLGIM
uniref:Uncharacterized protein n=1 Tax=Anguilla anguilla TaxID=7936 RepID=A0A0E9QR10_ANGAN